jgi:hypothetical protein
LALFSFVESALEIPRAVTGALDPFFEAVSQMPVLSPAIVESVIKPSKIRRHKRNDTKHRVPLKAIEVRVSEAGGGIATVPAQDTGLGGASERWQGGFR